MNFLYILQWSLLVVQTLLTLSGHIVAGLVILGVMLGILILALVNHFTKYPNSK